MSESPWGRVLAKYINPYEQYEGQVVEVGVTVQNIGSNAGYVLAVVRIEWDSNVEEPLWEYKWLAVGEEWTPANKYFTMKNKDVKVLFRAYGWRNDVWNKDDEWIDYVKLKTHEYYAEHDFTLEATKYVKEYYPEHDFTLEATKYYPMTIKVTLAGKPVANKPVTLIPKITTDIWNYKTINTDFNGIVSIDPDNKKYMVMCGAAIDSKEYYCAIDNVTLISKGSVELKLVEYKGEDFKLAVDCSTEIGADTLTLVTDLIGKYIIDYVANIEIKKVEAIGKTMYVYFVPKAASPAIPAIALGIVVVLAAIAVFLIITGWTLKWALPELSIFFLVIGGVAVAIIFALAKLEEAKVEKKPVGV